VKITGNKIYKKEGQQERLFTEIICTSCGHVSHERRSTRIQKALKADCMTCKGIAYRGRLKAAREASRHQKECDKALIAAHRSALRLHKRLTPSKRISHGLCRGETKRTYKIWRNMIRRCHNPKSTSFDLYGAKGVVVCQRWHDPQKFIDDMGIAPPGYSIERNDTHGNYEPLNCRWIPKSEQSANRRNCYINRHVPDVDAFKKQKTQLLRQGALDVETIPYGDKNGLGWWRDFGLYNNPYIYGPMPWKKTSLRHRKREAIERGWHKPKNSEKNNFQK